MTKVEEEYKAEYDALEEYDEAYKAIGKELLQALQEADKGANTALKNKAYKAYEEVHIKERKKAFCKAAEDLEKLT